VTFSLGIIAEILDYSRRMETCVREERWPELGELHAARAVLIERWMAQPGDSGIENARESIAAILASNSTVLELSMRHRDRLMEQFRGSRQQRHAANIYRDGATER